VLLGVETDDERRNIYDLFADTAIDFSMSGDIDSRRGYIPDVALADEHTGVVNALREAKLENLGLETTFQEVLNLQGKHVIETHAGLVEHTDANETTDERIALEETLRVLVVELEQLTCGTTNLGEDEGDTPDLALVAQAVLAGELGGVDESTGACRCTRVSTLSSESRRADSKGRRGTL
jgi:hypothetical protein